MELRPVLCQFTQLRGGGCAAAIQVKSKMIRQQTIDHRCKQKPNE